MNIHDSSAARPAFDPLLLEIARYVVNPVPASDLAYTTARWCLMDSLGCALLALQYPACTSMVGPIVPGATLAHGARVPGTDWELEPVQAAYCLGTLIRWLDYNDTWLAAEWGHPSDNWGAILMLADYLARARIGKPWLVRDVLLAGIKAYEIQGVLALANSFNRVGLDHVLLVRIASTAVASAMLGGHENEVANAVSNAWADGGALRVYRHAPNTGSRKSWAAGDATSRAVRLALWSVAGEMGYPAVLSTPHWGFQDVLFRGQSIQLPRPLGCHVMENILFKIAYPAEFHAQTAVEAAIFLHHLVAPQVDAITRVEITTQEAAMRIINKSGPLHNPADRDHCLQYMVAVGLLKGNLTAADYQDSAAADTRLDALRAKMVVLEDPRYSRDYLDPEKRSISNAVQVFFADGTHSERVEVEYPLGHRRRREEGTPLLFEKFLANVSTRLPTGYSQDLADLFSGPPQRLDSMSIQELMDRFIPL